MCYIMKKLIGILVPGAAGLVLWYLITSGGGEGAALRINDLILRLLTEMLNSA